MQVIRANTLFLETKDRKDHWGHRVRKEKLMLDLQVPPEKRVHQVPTAPIAPVPRGIPGHLPEFHLLQQTLLQVTGSRKPRRLIRASYSNSEGTKLLIQFTAAVCIR